LLTFWGVIFSCLVLFPMLLFWDLLICFWLVGGFGHLKSIPWIIFYVLERFVIG
jgi:hypothetical protein